jgi:hypothetical protein
MIWDDIPNRWHEIKYKQWNDTMYGTMTWDDIPNRWQETKYQQWHEIVYKTGDMRPSTNNDMRLYSKQVTGDKVPTLTWDCIQNRRHETKYRWYLVSCHLFWIQSDVIVVTLSPFTCFECNLMSLLVLGLLSPVLNTISCHCKVHVTIMTWDDE